LSLGQGEVEEKEKRGTTAPAGVLDGGALEQETPRILEGTESLGPVVTRKEPGGKSRGVLKPAAEELRRWKSMAINKYRHGGKGEREPNERG